MKPIIGMHKAKYKVKTNVKEQNYPIICEILKVIEI